MSAGLRSAVYAALNPAELSPLPARLAKVLLVFAIIGEQIRGLRPHGLVDVVAVDALQVLDVILIAQELHVLFQNGDAASEIL